jgi:hypothetical protein
LSGDTVSTLFDESDIALLFAPIDTLEEARLLPSTQTLLLDCPPGTYRQGWKQNADGSWELLVTYRECNSDVRFRMRIATAGTISVDGAESTNGICS